MKPRCRRIKFGSGTLEIGAPVEIGRDRGHFWFPSLHPVGAERALCLVARTDDVAQGVWPAASFLTRDGGLSWEPGPEGALAHSSVRIGEETTLVMPYELWPLSSETGRQAAAEGTIVTHPPEGPFSAERRVIHFLDFPHDLSRIEGGQLELIVSGNILELKGGRLFTTLYGRPDGRKRFRVYAAASDDGGFIWRFRSVVASPVREADHSEGPSESNTVRLPDGRLMCVYRVKGKLPYCRSFSSDEGSSWTPPERLSAAASVQPQLLLMPYGLLLLGGGRPGLFLWVCEGASGQSWERINLGEHHNEFFPDSSLHYSDDFNRGDRVTDPPQSTSYTSMRRISDNEALLCYDRLGDGWKGAPGPWGEVDAVFCMRLRVSPA